MRLDRVDRIDGDGLLVIDYKTGRIGSSEWKKPRPADAQLPAYALATGAEAIAWIGIDEKAVSLRGVAGDDLGIAGLTTLARALKSADTDWTSQLEIWRRDLTCLAEEFAAGDLRLSGSHAAMRLAAGEYAPLTRAFALKKPAGTPN